MTSVELYAITGHETVQLPLPDRVRTVHDAFDELPHGIYSALRTYGGHRFLRLEAHLARCERSTERAGWTAGFDFRRLAKAVDSLVRALPGDKSVRFELLEHPLVRDGYSTSLLIAVGPHLEVPSAVVERGANLALSPPGLARPVPLIKYSDWVVTRRVCESHAPHAFEWLLLDANRRILEGTSSNFYALVGGTVVTAGEGVLEGITGRVVRELIAARGVPVRFERLAVESLKECSEAFITSSSREVVPVSSVDGVSIGSGGPGKFATSLREEFRSYAEANARPATETP